MNTRRWLCLLTLAMCFGNSVFAQFSGHYNALNITGTSNVLKTEIPLGEPATVGSTYLREEWEKGTIVLRDGRTAGDYPVRVQLENGIIEVMLEDKPYTLNITNISYITLQDHALRLPAKLSNARKFIYEDKSLKGVVMVHDVDGSETKLINNYFIEFVPANYNVAMDVGSKENRKVTKQKLFVQKDGALKEIRGSNKKIVGVLGYDKSKAKTVIQANDLDLTEPVDLIAFLKIMG